MKRRRLLLGAGVGVGSSALLASSGTSWITASSGRPALAGVVTSIDTRRASLVVGTPEGENAIRIPDSAVLRRSGLATLGDFRRGDHVVVELETSRTPYVASLVTILYHQIEGRVTRLTARRLSTTGGEVDLSPETVVRPVRGSVVTAPTSSLRPGDAVAVLSAHDHAGGSHTARTIFVVTKVG